MHTILSILVLLPIAISFNNLLLRLFPEAGMMELLLLLGVAIVFHTFLIRCQRFTLGIIKRRNNKK